MPPSSASDTHLFDWQSVCFCFGQDLRADGKLYSNERRYCANCVLWLISSNLRASIARTISGHYVNSRSIHPQWLLSGESDTVYEGFFDDDIEPGEPEPSTLSPRSEVLRKLAEKLDDIPLADVYSFAMQMDDIFTGPDLALKSPVKVAKLKGRPAGSKDKRSITRDPSAFDREKCGI